MAITERTLKRWRREALKENAMPVIKTDDQLIYEHDLYITELNNRILRMTQELLDIHLLTKGK